MSAASTFETAGEPVGAHSGEHSGEPVEQAAFRRELDELADRTARELSQRRAVRVASNELVRALPLLLLVPGIGLLAKWFAEFSGTGAGRWNAVGVVLLAALPLFGWVAYRAWSTYLKRPSRVRALSALDRHLGLADRLRTADEFLELDATGAFERAAIEDAAHATRSARAAILPEVTFAFRPDLRFAAYVAATLLLSVWCARLTFERRAGAPEDEELAVHEIPGIDAGARERVDRRLGANEDETTVEAEVPREPRQRDAQEAVRADARATEVPDQVKESQGRTREGQSSDAQASSGSGQAKGSPSNQEQKSTGEPKAKPKPANKPAAADEKPEEEQARKQADEDSGSTAGRGSAKGSNKNSVASPWSSKDQVDTPEEEEIEDDDEFEDDAEEQKSRGGLQPNLRDRRPPVSRDLTISMGNRPSPDANGRGGPSDQKKSRGTASLVLGVPIPDRVKGQPNRGKTKITQERVEPRTEDAERVAAGQREPSPTPVGSVPSPDVAPRLRDAVRQYFIALRQRGSE